MCLSDTHIADRRSLKDNVIDSSKHTLTRSEDSPLERECSYRFQMRHNQKLPPPAHVSGFSIGLSQLSCCTVPSAEMMATTQVYIKKNRRSVKSHVTEDGRVEVYLKRRGERTTIKKCVVVKGWGERYKYFDFLKNKWIN